MNKECISELAKRVVAVVCFLLLMVALMGSMYVGAMNEGMSHDAYLGNDAGYTNSSIMGD